MPNPTDDDAYMAGADAGRVAAKATCSGCCPLDVLDVDLYVWSCGLEPTADFLQQSFRDGWMKAYWDVRAKLRAAARA